MADGPGLGELLTAEEFGRIARAFRKRFRLGLETTGPDGQAVESLCSADCRPAFCTLVRSDGEGRSRCLCERRRAVEIASQTGQSFITICHAGLVLVCVPMVDDEIAHGGLFFGKCLWEPVSPMLVRDVESRLAPLAIDRDKAIGLLGELPVVRGRQIHTAAEFLFGLL